MNYMIQVMVTVSSAEDAEEVRSEIAMALEDARDSGELPDGVEFSVEDAFEVNA